MSTIRLVIRPTTSKMSVKGIPAIMRVLAVHKANMVNRVSKGTHTVRHTSKRHQHGTKISTNTSISNNLQHNIIINNHLQIMIHITAAQQALITGAMARIKGTIKIIRQEVVTTSIQLVILMGKIKEIINNNRITNRITKVVSMVNIKEKAIINTIKKSDQ